ncbi:beta-lactamase/transpeptidase-like protein [Penicillium malachiteum]|uniref:beta-lactamase/transpeptidase-like protein n=1 Tax=Penicillium malachiteum TaxID=1324776 RepID=UPI002547969F|nr:beta-lactamase/transpeptidase-like protein [Penicillium malachiteum]KAJ5715358.1 beta-lactamase/transpeptidase-like protein [Penicillium malachiteum]
MADCLATDTQKDVVSHLEAAMSDVEDVMKMARVPSISLGIIHEGNLIFRKSIGLRDVENNLQANSDTSYLIGSCSKIITSTALGLLVEEGKLMWGG